MTQQYDHCKQIESDDKSKIRKLERSIRTFESDKENLMKVTPQNLIVMVIYNICNAIHI